MAAISFPKPWVKLVTAAIFEVNFATVLPALNNLRMENLVCSSTSFGSLMEFVNNSFVTERALNFLPSGFKLSSILSTKVSTPGSIFSFLFNAWL